MSKHTIDITDATFKAEVLESEKPVLVDFWAPWCGPCKMVAPVVEEIARDHTESLTVVKIDIDQNPAVASDFQIMSIPTLMVFHNGKVVSTIRGAKSKTFILRELQPVLDGKV